MSHEVVKVLSIDGGGIRGLIPALVLQAIETQTGRPISHSFDLITGTSTGALLALGLTVPDDQGRPRYHPQDLIDIYTRHGPEVFALSTWRKIVTLDSLIGPKYPGTMLELLLNHYLGRTSLSQTLTNVLIPTYDIKRHSPILFKTHKAKESPARNVGVAKLAYMAAAAPTYFPPQRVTALDQHTVYWGIDAGIYAPNPTLMGTIEALKLYPDCRELVIVSLGTGETNKNFDYLKIRRWGLVDWAPHILDIALDGDSDIVDYLTTKLFPQHHKPTTYFRFQTQLLDGHEQMDDVSPQNLAYLQSAGQALVTRESARLSALCRQLVTSSVL